MSDSAAEQDPEEAKRAAYREKIEKGYRFQCRVVDLLLSWGYLEGHVRAAPLPSPSYNHREQMRKLGHKRYSSPDVIVINSWMHGPHLIWKFGLCCSFRSQLWRQNGKAYITIPIYQAEDYKRICKEKGLCLYWAMGTQGDPEVRFVNIVNSEWDQLKIRDNAAKAAGRPFTVMAGFDWQKALTPGRFVADRINAGDPEVMHIIDKGLHSGGDTAPSA